MSRQTSKNKKISSDDYEKSETIKNCDIPLKDDSPQHKLGVNNTSAPPAQANQKTSILKSASSGQSCAESSTSALKTLPIKKLFMHKKKRKMLEIRRIQIKELPVHSSDSSLDADRLKTLRKRCFKRKSRLKRELFWRKYNHFLKKSFDCADSSSSSSSSDSGKISEKERNQRRRCRI